MENQSFEYTRWNQKTTLFVGQKVTCSYYNEYGIFMKDAYKRRWWEILFDKAFKPVKQGIIVGDAGIHPYWLSMDDNRKEQYLLVKFKEYRFAKPIPISCIKDAKEEAVRLEAFLKEGEHRIGQKGYSYEAFDKLSKQLNDLKKYTNQ